MVVSDVFDGARPEEIAAALNAFCLHLLGSEIERSELFRAPPGYGVPGPCSETRQARRDTRGAVSVSRLRAPAP